jgi:hypothetical protein
MAKRLIVLLGDPLYNEDNKAAEAIMPGHLLAFNGSGDLVKHATAAAPKAAMNIALEREEMGKGIDDAYAIGDTVKVGAFSPGMRFLGIIPTGQNLAKGAQVESDGAGRFRAVSTGGALARALEAVNNASGSDARIRLEVI